MCTLPSPEAARKIQKDEGIEAKPSGAQDGKEREREREIERERERRRLTTPTMMERAMSDTKTTE